MIENVLNRFFSTDYKINLKSPYIISGRHNIIHLNLKPDTYLIQMYEIDSISNGSNYKDFESILSRYITLLRGIYVQAKAVYVNNHWYLLIYAKDHEYLHEACHNLRELNNNSLRLTPCSALTKQSVMNVILFRSTAGVKELHHHILKINDNYYTILNVKPLKRSLHAFWLHWLTSLSNVDSVISFSTLNHEHTNRLAVQEISSLQAQDPNLTSMQQMKASQHAHNLMVLKRNLQTNNETLYNYSVQLIIHTHSKSKLKQTVNRVKDRFDNFKFTNGLNSKEDLTSLIVPLSHHIDNNMNHYLIQSYDLGGSYPFISSNGDTVSSNNDSSISFNRPFYSGQTSSRGVRIFGNVTLLDALVASFCIALIIIH